MNKQEEKKVTMVSCAACAITNLEPYKHSKKTSK